MPLLIALNLLWSCLLNSSLKNSVPYKGLVCGLWVHVEHQFLASPSLSVFVAVYPLCAVSHRCSAACRPLAMPPKVPSRDPEGEWSVSSGSEDSACRRQRAAEAARVSRALAALAGPPASRTVVLAPAAAPRPVSSDPAGAGEVCAGERRRPARARARVLAGKAGRPFKTNPFKTRFF